MPLGKFGGSSIPTTVMLSSFLAVLLEDGEGSGELRTIFGAVAAVREGPLEAVEDDLSTAASRSATAGASKSQ